MPRLRIDGREVEVAAGTTLLAAAKAMGVAIPTLCWREGFDCSTSCMVCAVKVAGRARLLPACATPVEEGMDVTTGDDEVRHFRREALELLLSDHTGDCEGPCRLACPAHLDVPAMVRAVQRGEWPVAALLARAGLVLPESLGMVCPAPCEKACRRAHVDGAVAVRDLHRAAAWRQHQAEPAGRPAVALASAPRVTIVGAGPTGLAAAAELARRGYRCVLLDDHLEAGGMLRYGVGEERLPAAVVAADVADVLALGIEFQAGVRIGSAEGLARCREDSAAVLLAMGTGPDAAALGVAMSGTGVRVDRETGATSVAGVFAAGGVVREIKHLAVRAVAAGKAVAEQIDHWLQHAKPGHHRPINVSLGHLREGEMALFLAQASAAGRVVDGCHAALPEALARTEASRCLHCDCRAAQACGLRALASEYGAAPHRWHGTRRNMEADTSHPEVVYEPGKCIACGLCTQVAVRHREPLGTAFLWRGISVRLGVPLGDTMAAALTASATECVATCPTGALAWKRD